MDRYAVVGNPVAHSLSPEIHHAFAAQTGQRLRYEKLPAPADGFRETAESFLAAGGHGLNVTLPFKGDAFVWVHEARGAAVGSGAVNTIAVEDGRTVGYNTDGEGLVADLTELGIELNGSALLVLGAGGAVRGVVPALVEAGAGRVVIANRTVAKARSLAASYPANVESAALDALTPGFDVVVNGTSAGLAGQGALIDARIVRQTACYDMLYSRDGGTPFCTWAREAGASMAADGLGMLVEQAAAAFEIWRGVRPDSRAVLGALRQGGRVNREASRERFPPRRFRALTRTERCSFQE